MRDAGMIESFVKLLLQLRDACGTVSELAKKRPNDGVNKFKLGFFNSLLKEANLILPEKYLPQSAFREFQEDLMPTNSDVMMMLSQYLACLTKYGKDNIVYFDFSPYWVVGGKRSNIKADRSIFSEE